MAIMGIAQGGRGKGGLLLIYCRIATQERACREVMTGRGRGVLRHELCVCVCVCARARMCVCVRVVCVGGRGY